MAGTTGVPFLLRKHTAQKKLLQTGKVILFTWRAFCVNAFPDRPHAARDLKWNRNLTFASFAGPFCDFRSGEVRPVSQTLFDQIVLALNAICRRTGFSYAALNILIYCGAIPWTWCFLVALRTGWTSLGALAAILTVGVAFWLRFSQSVAIGRFYACQIAQLEEIATGPAFNYTGVSLILGVLAPALIPALLLTLPRRWLVPGWILLNAALCAFLLRACLSCL